MNADRLSGHFPDIIEAWAALQQTVSIRPIRNEKDYQTMLQLSRELATHLNGDAQSALDDLHGVLVTLIEAWETRVVAMPKAEPREVLRHLLETHGLKQKDLAGIASPTVVSDILAGRRAISKNVAKALAARFHADVSVFL
ncbi:MULTISPECIES: helix-turn-helix domain-containing protein [Paraburkholderia]|jgi:HTH-type transcriptional regulator/antitoxin HigA|uniref:HTH-type transcriptional regulator / antitoxin HigA n=1 Tax=Paraburkholderia phenazinium TaxID=60549 RepID=A0A1N6KLQ5_9BURK|nr:transcriptional regulator [Paraburkholderia phenazinium]SIO57484.1 HTH-type transcriptional regulator / antitoxin HigA [Paraburkholderia phenazinium]